MNTNDELRELKISKGKMEVGYKKQAEEIMRLEKIIRQAAAELARLRAIEKALEICLMFLTNVNTITEEKQAELVRLLKNGGMEEQADAVALSGFAAALNESEKP